MKTEANTEDVNRVGSTDLLACPFCGEIPVIEKSPFTDGAEWVVCSMGCGAAIEDEYRGRSCREIWNTRHQANTQVSDPAEPDSLD